MTAKRWGRGKQQTPDIVTDETCHSGSTRPALEEDVPTDFAVNEMCVKMFGNAGQGNNTETEYMNKLEGRDLTRQSTANDARSTQRKTKKSLQQKAQEKLVLTPDLKVFTCGCGDLSAYLLCELLVNFGIHSVLDVRALPKSKKKPWFNSENLAKSMRAAGLMYSFVGKGRKSHTVIATLVQKHEQPVCLLGFRGSPLECSRLVLSEKLLKGVGWQLVHLEPCGDTVPHREMMATDHSIIFGRYSTAINEIRGVQSKLERTFGFSGHWRSRVLARYGSVSYTEWSDHVVSSIDPTVVELPWGSIMMVLPKFTVGSELQDLQRNTLPGAIAYEQPLRRTVTAEGTVVSFKQRHKEAWFSNEYEYADPKRASPPYIYKRHLLEPWTDSLLEQAARAALTPFNGLFCRWEPPGAISDEGPHTFARGSPMLEYSIVAMLSLSGSRYFRVHGLGCWEKLSVDVPIHEGSLVVFGGPLKERWLYWHVRDMEAQGERVLMTFQLHADCETPEVYGCGGQQKAAKSGTDQLPLNCCAVTAGSASHSSSKNRWRRSEK